MVATRGRECPGPGIWPDVPRSVRSWPNPLPLAPSLCCRRIEGGRSHPLCGAVELRASGILMARLFPGAGQCPQLARAGVGKPSLLAAPLSQAPAFPPWPLRQPQLPPWTPGWSQASGAFRRARGTGSKPGGEQGGPFLPGSVPVPCRRMNPGFLSVCLPSLAWGFPGPPPRSASGWCCLAGVHSEPSAPAPGPAPDAGLPELGGVRPGSSPGSFQLLK